MPTRPFLVDGNGSEVNWTRMGIVASLVVALMAVWTGLGIGQKAADAMPWATEAEVEQVREDTDRNSRALRCLLRADPREGPAIDQCESDPLERQ